MRKTEFTDHDANVAIGNDFIKLMVDEMPIIPRDVVQRVLGLRAPATGPASRLREANPYANIVNNWANSKYILTQLKPAQ